MLQSTWKGEMLPFVFKALLRKYKENHPHQINCCLSLSLVDLRFCELIHSNHILDGDTVTFDDELTKEIFNATIHGTEHR